MTKKKIGTLGRNFIILVFLLVITFIIGRQSAPVKTEIKEVEKIRYIEKVDLKKSTSKNTEKEEIKTITQKPDGTKITRIETRVKNKDKIDEYKEKSVSKVKSKESQKITTYSKRHTISILAFNPQNFNEVTNNHENFGLMYQNNLFLGVQAGVGANFKGDFFLSLGLSF